VSLIVIPSIKHSLANGIKEPEALILSPNSRGIGDLI
jgi:hypothetical protein